MINQNDNRATSQIDTDLFHFLLITSFQQQSVNSLKKRLVILVTVAFRGFWVFISKELLRKSRILVKTCLVRSKSLLSIFFRVLRRVYLSVLYMG